MIGDAKQEVAQQGRGVEMWLKAILPQDIGELQPRAAEVVHPRRRPDARSQGLRVIRHGLRPAGRSSVMRRPGSLSSSRSAP